MAAYFQLVSIVLHLAVAAAAVVVVAVVAVAAAAAAVVQQSFLRFVGIDCPSRYYFCRPS